VTGPLVPSASSPAQCAAHDAGHSLQLKFIDRLSVNGIAFAR
jgi:hypothetical protein